MKVLISSGFLETEQSSFRENQYSRLLALAGVDVVIHTSTESSIWKFNRAKSAKTNPGKFDDNLKKLGVEVIRKKPIIRYADFLILPIPLKKIREADIVHIIEFRQGNGALVAMAARFFGKPVVYDHEQRGDRHYTIFHTLDSLVRRFFIGIGSIFVCSVRHTVHANRDHFLKNSWVKNIPLHFSPLGSDERYFKFDVNIRNKMRSELNIAPTQIVVAVTGKLDETKRSAEAIEACLDRGYEVIVAGTLTGGVENRIKAHKNSCRIKNLGRLSAEKLNEVYCAADIAIFTTFTISYWEALSTGLSIVVPKTSFSDIFCADEKINLFGYQDMFLVPEEQYKDNFSVRDGIDKVLDIVKINDKNRISDNKYGWPGRIGELIALYDSVLLNNDRLNKSIK